MYFFFPSFLTLIGNEKFDKPRRRLNNKYGTRQCLNRDFKSSFRMMKTKY